MMESLQQLQKKAFIELQQVIDHAGLRDFELRYLGRKGELTVILRQLKDVPAEQRKVVGQAANAIKQQLTEAINSVQRRLGSRSIRESAPLELTWPGRPYDRGHFHPLTQYRWRIEDIFLSMGFEVVDGPEIETTRYNFDLLNIPKEHPSRDIMDTFYLEHGLVLRTHTSPVQLRAMETRRPPVRLVYPGRSFRHEATDASHETTFYQYECLVIDRCVTVANLLATLQQFFNALYGSAAQIRALSSFFPFTEPSLEISMSCLICQGKGCSVCQQSGWLEMLGAGMVHPQVLKNMKIDPAEYSGFAFGGGLDRLMMLSYGVNDIRLSYSGDLRFLEQF